MLRFIAIVIILAILAAGGWYGYQRYTVTEAPSVISTAVTKGDIEETVLATGILKPVRLVAVGAQVSGRITALKVDVGEVVKAGDLVAEIDSKTQVNDLRTAKAALESMRSQKAEKEATLVYASTQLTRQEEMLAQHATSRSDYEAAIETVKTTEAQIAALTAQIVEAEVAVETAEINLGYTQITAPINGTVLWVSAQEGQTVNATQSTPTIIILGQLDAMRVRAEISEVDVVKVKPGQTVYFTILGNPDKRYEATLESVEPAPESIQTDSSITSSSSSSSSSSTSTSAIYYNAVFTVPNPDGYLKTYMTAEVHVVVGEARDVLTVPSVALASRRADGRYTVKVVAADGTTSQRVVEVGLNNKVKAEIRSGLEAGERVVIGESSGNRQSTTTRRMPRMF